MAPSPTSYSPPASTGATMSDRRTAFDVYYGMADSRIGVARLDVPDFVPTGGVADPLEARV